MRVGSYLLRVFAVRCASHWHEWLSPKAALQVILIGVGEQR